MKFGSDRSQGDLMTRPSNDDAGNSNYVVNRDFRRGLFDQVRREGDKLFQPITPGVGDMQATPNYPDVDEAITLQFTAKQDNGKAALIVGTQTTLYRFWAYEDNDILEAGIVAADIVGVISGGVWLVIGSGFSTAGHRWEAKNVGGYTIFNNGVDLPVSYHLNEFSVTPIHELREQGVAYVGTIEEIAGILVCADIGEIQSEQLEAVINSVGYGRYSDTRYIDRVHYQILWGDPMSPLRWGSSVPGTMVVGDRTLSLKYDIASLQPGDAIRVVGAGLDGADLLTTLGFKSGTRSWTLLDAAETAITELSVSKQDARSLIVGQYPLLDDASAVIRVKKLGDRLLIAKVDGFVLGEYTGDRSLPFVFTRIYSGEEGVHWSWTLVEINGQVIYAGRTEFYTFDLVSRRPKQHPRLTLCSDIFFDQVATATQDQVFAADNGLTKEIWFVFPSATADKGIAYDYRPRELGGDRCSTIGASYSAAAMIEVPSGAISHTATDKWFLLGISDGTLLQYLFDRTGPLGWQRRGVSFNSDLWAGLTDFGDEDNEKSVKQYTLLMSSHSPETSVSVALYAAKDPADDSAAVDEKPAALPGSPAVFATPKKKNTVFTHYLAHLFQDRITVTGVGNAVIARRRWDADRQGGAGITRK